MPKIQYKHKTGALHVGGGRFFYANEPVEVTSEEAAELIETYEDLEEVETVQEEENSQDVLHTKTSLKKLNADQQKDVITSLGGDPEATGNEEERIALILSLQEEAGE
ncbi:hypothetical protein BTO30_12625 [Domibacillus antri]|uniref:YqbF C-terminal domain-containing protein n=1 Tax=Domibacillus antri TaxID=1714264 RepID=A0A1Q8Q3F2_9BACI|nr:hypothetical protein [Domibacillus antri]OLN21857.1 hypothetical protein BTO30_12625 [Domibacillus antri]